MTLLTTNASNITFEPTPLFFLLVAFIVFIIVDRIIKKSKKKKTEKALSELKIGDKITLSNGMFGKVISHVEGTVDIELSSGARARFMDWAVAEINGKKL